MGRRFIDNYNLGHGHSLLPAYFYFIMSWKKIYTILIILGLIYLNGLIYITSHESIHKYIFKREGIRSRIEYEFPLHAKTVPYGKNIDCSQSCNYQHALNDIVGYNTVLFISSLWFMLFTAYLMYKNLLE